MEPRKGVEPRKGTAGKRADPGRQAGMGKTPPASRGERPGTGALCPEAQADGVPCFELGRDCEVCEHARPEGGSHRGR